MQVDCVYPGANARVVAETVAAPLEEEVNGVEGMMYMSSQCGNDGSYNLSITFRHGMDLNMAQVLVQNRVNLAMPRLPDVIKRSTVTIRKRSPDILLSAGFFSTDGRYDQLYLSNYALMQVREELARVPGVSDVTMVGQRDYSMRIWLDPGKLAVRGLTANDVVRAIREQNTPVAAGHLGQQPAPSRQGFQMPLNVHGRLSDAEEFGNIVLKTGEDGRLLRLKDVGRVELGPKNVDLTCHVDGHTASSVTVWQLPDANALETADRVKAKLEELKKGFPPGVDYVIRYDTTPYIRESIGEVVKTLRDAVILVAVVVLLFLQNWRSALIPLIAVPVAIVGTFAFMAALGFSLNNLTLFGLVLAIGIVVDDAIVVVEAVEHHIELGLAPREATIKAMEQVSGPVVAVGLVLSAVFVPCAFIGGITGLFFRQFALTIAVSTIISAFNSLTLSPALTALLLKPHDKHIAPPLPRLAFLLAGGWSGWLLSERLTPALATWVGADGPHLPRLLVSLSPCLLVLLTAAAGWLIGGVLNRVLGWSFRLFNAGFGLATGWYTRTVGMLLRVSLVVLVVYGGLIALTYWHFNRTPKGFIPTQDMGYLLINAQLPDAASSERTQEVMNQAEQIVLNTPGIKHALVVSGQSFLLSANGSNFGSMFVILDDFDKRQDRSLTADALAATLRGRFRREVLEADFAILGPPPVRGVGRAGGFKLMIEDRGDLGMTALQEHTDRLAAAGGEKPGLVGLSSVFRANVPQLYIDVDPNEVRQKHVSLKEVTDTLEVYQGSLYVNDFNLFGRTWQVIVQAESPYRQHPEAIGQLEVRNEQNKMVPLGSLASVREVNGPLIVTRYNMYPAAFINGTGAPGTSSGQAIELMEKLARANLPRTMSYEWTETAYLELQAGNTAMIIFGLSVALVFLVLAALYESWSLPLAVILIVPLCLLSSVVGVGLAQPGHQHPDASRLRDAGGSGQQERDPGRGVRQAAARGRRVAPPGDAGGVPATSTADRHDLAGLHPRRRAAHGLARRRREMRRTLGTAVFSGMLGVTVVGLFLTPVFFSVIDWLSHSAAFTSRPARLLGVVMLDVATLGLHRLVGPLIQSRRRVRPVVIPSVNGKAKLSATAIIKDEPMHSPAE